MPDVFVLDEPTSNLDIGTIRDLQEILLSWKAQGKTVIIAEHRLAWLRNIVDRILFFQDGKIAEDMEASVFLERNSLPSFNKVGCGRPIILFPNAENL